MRSGVRVVAACVVLGAVIVGGAWLYAASIAWFAPRPTTESTADCILRTPRGPTLRLAAIDPIHRWLVAADKVDFRVTEDFGARRQLARRSIPELTKDNDLWGRLTVFDGGRKVFVQANNPSRGDSLAAFNLPDLTDVLRFKRRCLGPTVDASNGSLLVEEINLETRHSIFWRLDAKGTETRMVDCEGPNAAWTLSQDKGLLAVAKQDGRVVVFDVASGKKLHEWTGDRHVWRLAISRNSECIVAYVRDDPWVGIVARDLATGKWRWAKPGSESDDHFFHGVVEDRKELVVEVANIDRDGVRRATVAAWRLSDGEPNRKLPEIYAAPFVYIDGTEIKAVEMKGK